MMTKLFVFFLLKWAAHILEYWQLPWVPLAEYFF